VRVRSRIGWAPWPWICCDNLDDHPAVLVRLDEELIGLAHHGQRVGQPQASAVWQATDGDQMVRLGWSREQHDEDFPVAILITITRVRAS